VHYHSDRGKLATHTNARGFHMGAYIIVTASLWCKENHVRAALNMAYIKVLQSLR